MGDLLDVQKLVAVAAPAPKRRGPLAQGDPGRGNPVSAGPARVVRGAYRDGRLIPVSLFVIPEIFNRQLWDIYNRRPQSEEL